MEVETAKQAQTSVFPDGNIQFVSYENPMFDTWFVCLFLIITAVVLKTFIYTKDKKRHSK